METKGLKIALNAIKDNVINVYTVTKNNITIFICTLVNAG